MAEKADAAWSNQAKGDGSLGNRDGGWDAGHYIGTPAAHGTPGSRKSSYYSSTAYNLQKVAAQESKEKVRELTETVARLTEQLENVKNTQLVHQLGRVQQGQERVQLRGSSSSAAGVGRSTQPLAPEAQRIIPPQPVADGGAYQSAGGLNLAGAATENSFGRWFEQAHLENNQQGRHRETRRQLFGESASGYEFPYEKEPHLEFQEQEGDDERRPKYHEGAREFSENELKGDALKLLLDTFKNLPDLPKLHYGGLRVTENQASTWNGEP